MSLLVTVNSLITLCTYGVVLFFLVAIVRNLIKTKNVQDVLIYCVMLIPFVLRILRLK